MNISPKNNQISQNNYSYLTISKKHINVLINKIRQCTPLIAAFAMIGAILSIIPQVESHPIVPMPSTTTESIPEDVKIISLDKLVCPQNSATGVGGSLKFCPQQDSGDRWCSIL